MSQGLDYYHFTLTHQMFDEWVREYSSGFHFSLYRPISVPDWLNAKDLNKVRQHILKHNRATQEHSLSSALAVAVKQICLACFCLGISTDDWINHYTSPQTLLATDFFHEEGYRFQLSGLTFANDTEEAIKAEMFMAHTNYFYQTLADKSAFKEWGKHPYTPNAHTTYGKLFHHNSYAHASLARESYLKASLHFEPSKLFSWTEIASHLLSDHTLPHQAMSEECCKPPVVQPSNKMSVMQDLALEHCIQDKVSRNHEQINIERSLRSLYRRWHKKNRPQQPFSEASYRAVYLSNEEAFLADWEKDIKSYYLTTNERIALFEHLNAEMGILMAQFSGCFHQEDSVEHFAQQTKTLIKQIFFPALAKKGRTAEKLRYWINFLKETEALPNFWQEYRQRLFALQDELTLISQGNPPPLVSANAFVLPYQNQRSIQESLFKNMMVHLLRQKGVPFTPINDILQPFPLAHHDTLFDRLAQMLTAKHQH